jgi:shikimate dehydrogenase
MSGLLDRGLVARSIDYLLHGPAPARPDRVEELMTPTRTFLSALTGSFAQPAAENPTVAMVEAAYRHHGLDARYLNCEVAPAGLGDAVRGARAMGWAGFNCSIPHKVAVIQYLDGLGRSAEVIGAVNCVVRRGEKLIGENTDGQGFVQSLRTVADPAGQHLVLFGAGGAARAIGVETALAGAARITVVNRGASRGQELARLLSERTPAQAEFVAWDGPYAVPGSATIVVNATSIGLYPDVEARLDLDLDSLRPDLVVADVIPNPPSTPLLRQAAARGCRTLDGLGMLVNQGVIGIKHWTGVDADPGVMRRTLTELFG